MTLLTLSSEYVDAETLTNNRVSVEDCVQIFDSAENRILSRARTPVLHVKGGKRTVSRARTPVLHVKARKENGVTCKKACFARESAERQHKAQIAIDLWLKRRNSFIRAQKVIDLWLKRRNSFIRAQKVIDLWLKRRDLRPESVTLCPSAPDSRKMEYADIPDFEQYDPLEIAKVILLKWFPINGLQITVILPPAPKAASSPSIPNADAGPRA